MADGHKSNIHVLSRLMLGLIVATYKMISYTDYRIGTSAFRWSIYSLLLVLKLILLVYTKGDAELILITILTILGVKTHYQEVLEIQELTSDLNGI